MEFSALSARLEKFDIDQHASTLHGVVTGYICGGGWADRMAAITDWLGAEPGEEGRAFFDRLLDETRRELADPEFGFRPALPGDETSLSYRSRAIGCWCAGFISGFGLAGKFQEDTLEDEVKEVLSDLHRISTMTDEVPEDDDNEADITEITEYLRVAALLIFASCALEEGGD